MTCVCVPVLKRYDLLRELLLSLAASELQPDGVYVVDNGMNLVEIEAAVDGFLFPIIVHTPTAPMGVAESWNWFIEHVPGDPVITNDDITFAPNSLESMTASKASFISCSFGFSCFLIRRACIESVGLFDETISPHYAYFEDMDYLRRMKLAGICDEVVLCGVQHKQSSTPARYTSEEWNEHHAKFLLAESNYVKKWKNAPTWDQLAAIGGAGANA